MSAKHQLFKDIDHAEGKTSNDEAKQPQNKIEYEQKRRIAPAFDENKMPSIFVVLSVPMKSVTTNFASVLFGYVSHHLYYSHVFNKLILTHRDISI